jgi:hypothetical protein
MNKGQEEGEAKTMSADHYKVIRAVTDFYGAGSTDQELEKFLEIPRNVAMLEEAMSGIKVQLDEFRQGERVQYPFDPQKDASGAEEKSSPRSGQMALGSAETVNDEHTEMVEKKEEGRPVQENSNSTQQRLQEGLSKLGMDGQLGDPEKPATAESTSFNCNPADATESQPQEPATVVEQKPVPRAKPAAQKIVEVPVREHIKPDVSFRLPNARIGVEYDHEVAQYGKDHAEITEINHLEKIGLRWDEVRQRVVGTPTKDGTHKVSVIYTRTGEANKWKSDVDFVTISDPKDLWKDIPSSRSEPFWKPDSEHSGTESGSYLLVGASRRGRSHAHVGTCRDDDFSLGSETRTGWRILAVSDGAGSSKFSREGSNIAVRVSSGQLSGELDSHNKDLMAAMNSWYESKTDDHRKHLKQVVYSVFRNPVYKVVQELHKLAGQNKASFKDFYATLLIGAHKEAGGRHYVVGYWRGDGAIALFEEDKYLNLMGSPDGGEYAGQTRFMDAGAAPQEDILARVRFDVVDDMSALMLLTDGITDPLFDSENDLNGLPAWNRYWKRRIKQLLGDDPVSSSEALLESLDFWSVGNHDDRTIAVLYKKGIAESQQAAEIDTADMKQGTEPVTEDTQADVEKNTSDEDNVDLVDEALTDLEAGNDEPADAELADSDTPDESADPGEPEAVNRKPQESTVGLVTREY